ncbi:hypothetical protein AK830_g3198 [Neonectria ditissima]|uniref:Helicase C-terminal domain-containing protein n=1 Tax=Neonectria ditissima TaxID=78410 RepID=A0A0P7BPV0_9HYPO|nr:hypothetical protein AK830_g3198 [Neonectria ditissima]
MTGGISMRSLKHHMTTAEEAMALEDGEAHPLRAGLHSAKYFEILKARRQLPVSERRQDFLNVYHSNQVTVLSGDTGSGKSTQIPQFVFFDEFASGKVVACTQPRRLAAISVARRVADEMRWEMLHSLHTCIIIDEDERTVSTDILMALLKIAIVSRPDLKGSLEVLPLYSSLSPSDQDKVFGKSSVRKCIVTTNIAETSLTIDGIAYVIDPGVVKRSGYNPRAGLRTLLTAPISKASAQQRAGRAGRTRPGVCFRLYEADTYDEVFLSYGPPGILESEITSEILLLMNMGFHDVSKFDFIDCPHPEVYLRSIFLRPYAQRYVADAARVQFFSPLSDHMTQLNALHAYVRTKLQQRMDMKQWHFDAFLSQRTLQKIVQVRAQLKGIAQGLLNEPLKALNFMDKDYSVKIRKTLAWSFFYHSAFHREDEGDDLYVTVHGSHPAGVHPDSALVGLNHEWVVYDIFVYLDENLSRKRNGALRQPNVKAALDRA